MKKFSTLSLSEMKALHKKCAKEYFENGSSELSDQEFDRLEETIISKDPSWAPPIGYLVEDKKAERELPVPLPSLDKIQADNPKALRSFLDKFDSDHEFRIESKIDGASVGLLYIGGDLTRVTTRGNGTLGKSIDGFKRYFPQSIPTNQPTVFLRLEVVMPIKAYEQKWSAEYDSTRVIASSAFNRKEANTRVMKDLHFVLLDGWIQTNKGWKGIPPGDLDKLSGFHRPLSMTVASSELNVDYLSKTLAKYRSANLYDLDGLVIRSGTAYRETATPDNPFKVKAFKVNDLDSAVETEIEEVIWNTSSFGALVPKARVRPVKFGNVTVQFAALHNVVWASERGAGVGAKVRILRSGEIIPKIVQVVEPVRFKMPSKKVYGEYSLQGTRLILDSAESPEVRTKKIARMFAVLGMDSLGGGLAKKMVEAGFNTTSKVLQMSLEEVQELDGVKASAKKIYTELQRVYQGEFRVEDLFLACGEADSGLGSTTMSKLRKQAPQFLSSKSQSPNVLELTKILGPATASAFAQSWPKFLVWMNEVRPSVRKFEAQAPKKGKLTGKFFSWTGYRSEEEESWVKANGGEIIPFGTRTSVLFYRPDGKTSSKVQKAGNRAKTFAEFR